MYNHTGHAYNYHEINSILEVCPVGLLYHEINFKQ